ncbi:MULTISPECIES: hypothetical protein [Sorangium]|uniref:Uncharacterized protein n=1 Tax=Sorangium cellulosum (strain So ce56) TaxID=448385 RepID=A9GME9_SORC5|nr:hypothetical protein [Sorangium cellulosum]CAN93426.1 hypothetical protein predicted by Glimmer/Critica [Sorangium cellulosum So ce56]
MSLSFSGPKGWIEQRWIVYALMRDSIQHHLEDGRPSAEFAAIHGAAAALGGQRVMLPARKLHDELRRARAELAGRPIDALAISGRTRAVLSLRWPPPEGLETMLVTDWGDSVPLLGAPRGDSLDDVFGHLLDGLLRITEGASESDHVEIMDL